MDNKQNPMATASTGMASLPTKPPPNLVLPVDSLYARNTIKLKDKSGTDAWSDKRMDRWQNLS